MEQPECCGLKSYPWRISYKTSATLFGEKPVDILHEFYVPVLARSVKYDRVAGYFSSTSLAAASQGFSALVEKHGTIRLIVGADLDPDDVQAILSGEQERLDRALNKELAGEESWPVEVKRGVRLLAWMVSNGYLDVKVAFRIHGKTGKPIPLHSVEDGYVHEKWAIFSDSDGNSLYISGSLNESKTALVINAENIDVHCSWHGGTEQRRVEENQKVFENLWGGNNPCIKVMELPEAVKQRLVNLIPRTSDASFLPDGDEPLPELLEIDGTTAIKPKIPPPSPLELLKFAILRDGPKLPKGRYVGMATAPVAPWPHQAVVARRLIDTWPYSYLLCDEVGLGKTIEAGLVIRSLYLSGLTKRVLIAAPASLTRQWQGEMARKFLLCFGRAISSPSMCHEYTIPDQHSISNQSLYEPSLTIISTGLLARQERRGELRSARSFDIALVDEAHYARRSNPAQGCRVSPKFGHLYRAMKETLRDKCRTMYLATATPMQIDPVEAADLVQLTNRVGGFQNDPSLILAYYDLVGKLVDTHKNGPLKETEWEFLRQAVKSVEIYDPMLWKFIKDAVIDGSSSIAVRRWLENGTVPHGRDLKGVTRLIFAAAPLQRVMLRHSRPLLEIYRQQGHLNANLAKREILPIPEIRMTPQEQAVYDQFQLYCDGLAGQVVKKQGKNQSAMGFLLSFLRLRFASSMFAISETLRRRAEAVDLTLRTLGKLGVAEDEAPDEEELESLIDDADDIEEARIIESLLKNRSPADLEWEKGQLANLRNSLGGITGRPSKMSMLLKVLDENRKIPGTGRVKQTVIFTRFYDTLTDIVKRLREVAPGMLIGTYSGQGGQYVNAVTGQMCGVERDEIKHRFLRGEIDVLVCTDAAAEGLNLQTADWLINFDLPWNPMKVEQRIGRIDRIGQKFDTIYVLNLCYLGSAEEQVYGRLLGRLRKAEMIVGSQQVSLLPVTREEFQKLAEGKLKPAELEKTAKERIRISQKRNESMEVSPQDLYQIYLRFETQMNSKRPPVEMDGIWKTLTESSYLRDLGCSFHPEPDKKILTVAGVPCAVDGAQLTTSRETFDYGTKDEVPLHFASYGDTTFDGILEMFDGFGLPSCIRRISLPVPATDTEYVGYVVASYDDQNLPTCRLITSLADIETLRLDAERALTDVDIAVPMHQLEEALTDEFGSIGAIKAIERHNQEAARAQFVLAHLIISCYLQSRQRMGQGSPNFFKEMEVVEGVSNKVETILRIPKVPADICRKIQPFILFEVALPTIGVDGHIDAPPPLLRAGIEAAYRLADSMKVRHSELSTDMFINRVEKEIQRELSRFAL